MVHTRPCTYHGPYKALHLSWFIQGLAPIMVHTRPCTYHPSNLSNIAQIQLRLWALGLEFGDVVQFCKLL
jgi:hypothetical protein